MRISDWSSDVCSSDLTVNLNYIYVVPEARGRGNLERSVRAVAQAAGEVFARPSKDVVIFIEQNDPLRMAEADQLRDTVHSGMDQYDRLAIWGRRGARVVDFPYVQPPLSAENAPNNELILSVIGRSEENLPAALLRRD